jgi:RNA polymerase sigma-70 factor (ECF subfamily)
MSENKNTENPEDLIKLAQSGDEIAFESLYNLYYTPVYRYFYTRLKNKDTATDLTQTVFMKVYSSLQSFKNTGASPLAYFFTIARNSLIDYFRKEKHGTIYNDDMVKENDEQTKLPNKDKYTEKENKEIILQAMDILTKEQAEVITLRFMNDLPTKEVADIVGKSEEAVRQLQSRGLKMLRDYFVKENIF